MTEQPKRILVIEGKADFNDSGETVVVHDDGIVVHVYPTDGAIPPGWEDLKEEYDDCCGDEDDGDDEGTATTTKEG